jgi:formylglycine-generating enzyme required for sulfatase activity
MGQTEVTLGQWKALSGGTNPSYFQSTTGTGSSTANANDSGPAESLDWYAAVAFANARSVAEGLTSCYTLTGCTDAANGWKDGGHAGCTAATFAGLTCTGYRLPTESEWEYAARAGTTTATYGGNLSATSGCVTLSGTGGFAAGTGLASLAWYDCNAASRTQATGSKLPNAWGLYDMLGNVWEWTGDWYAAYAGSASDPLGAGAGSARVIRGGSWNFIARRARAAIRASDTPGNRGYDQGFRLSRTAFGPLPLGTACTLNDECASGFCATGPAGTANDRCAPEAMNYIPAGTFTMGSPATEVGRETNETQHAVTISRSFFMGQTEVTQGQGKALSGGTNLSYFQSTTGTGSSTANANDSGPAEQMDWYAAVAFANARSASEGLTSCYALTGCADATNGWKDGIHTGCMGATFAGLTCTGYRLPTESEWEYAARGGTTGATYLGNLSGGVDYCSTAQANLDGIAWWCRNSGSRTQAVGGKAANSFGLSDMLGNVYEWTGDWYNATYPGTVTDPLGASTGSSRVFRGGCWTCGARFARAALHSGAAPGFRSYYLGFRLSRTAP